MVTCWASSPAASSLWRAQQMHGCLLGLDFKAAQPWDCHPCDSLSTTSRSQKWNVSTAESCCTPLEQATARLGLILYGQEWLHTAHALTKGCWDSHAGSKAKAAASHYQFNAVPLFCLEFSTSTLALPGSSSYSKPPSANLEKQPGGLTGEE